MATVMNSFVFCADYSDMAGCLFAIQAMSDSGGFANDAQALQLLDIFDQDVLKKLYNTAVGILATLEGIEVSTNGNIVGDFSNWDFSSIDFSVGFIDGEFEYWDFSDIDFNTGFIDVQNDSFSSRFQSVLNIFALLCKYNPGISDTDAQTLIAAFIPVLDAFKALQNYLIGAGLNPCISAPQYFNNSTSLILQASGSDGSNDIVAGIHLRWMFAGDLGENHLPQGDYANTSPGTAPYDRANDFVSLFRTPYINPVVFTLDFSVAFPAIDYSALCWTYILNTTAGSQSISNYIRLTFTSLELYNQTALTVNPQVNPFNFLKAYSGLLQITIDNKSCFAIGYDFRLDEGSTSAALKMQVLALFDSNGTPTESVTVQKTITASTSDPVTGRFTGENITQITLQQSPGGYLQSFSFETYDDFTTTREDSDWTSLGSQFALSLTDDTVFDRLENSNYPVDDLWPQYRDGTRVRVANYQDKWLNTHSDDISIKTGVQNYLELSRTDPRAMATLVSQTTPDGPGLVISYLDMLNVITIDYHLARMLGLGYIDAQITTADTTKYIYKVSYTNQESLTSTAAALYQCISLPTGIADSRLSEKPVMLPISYTIPANNGFSGSVFNSDGYALNAIQRVINIGRELYESESGVGSYFNDDFTPADFNIFDSPLATLYGIEYRLASQTNYIKPGITSNTSLGYPYYAYDDDFPDTGILEVVLVPDNQTSLYIQLEDQPGIHAYAIYSVNLFSRASILSDEVQTDDTEFPSLNRLLPPSALTAQYIQQEDPLLFTTDTEQTWLSGRIAQFPGQDVNFTRITFNWVDITDLSYVKDITTFDFSTLIKPNTVKAWFKPGQPLQVSGIIADILPVINSDTQLQIVAGDFALLDGTQSSPVIATADLNRFVGCLLSTAEGQFLVDSVTEGLSLPLFVIEKAVQVITVNDPDNPAIFTTRNTYVMPAIGSRFTVTENLSNPDNWLPVDEEIQLIDLTTPGTPVTETSTDQYGNISRNLIGGINGNAVILQLHDVTDQSLLPGYYSVTFSPDFNLAPHPQNNLPFDPANPSANSPGTLQPPYIEWYNGQVRLPLAADATTKKLLDVIRIVQTNPLVLYIYDGGYQDNTIQISASPTDLVAQVNYHPGYRGYLYPEPPPTYYFNGSNMLPQLPDRSKKTMIGLQAADIGTGRSGFTSQISPPAVLLATLITPPVQLPEPLTYGLRVRPDATAKAAFTFDTEIAPDASGNPASPFGFMFYRTANEDILDALYAPATVTTILTKLESLTGDADFNQRYYELANLVFDPAHPGSFNVFDAIPAPYGFPVPDKTGLTSPTDTQAIKITKYQAAIAATLLPLTAQTPIFSLLKQGYQTENTLPVIRTIDGNLLDTSAPAFDPFPMIRQYADTIGPNINYVRVTDYTLNGSSRFLYFYGSAEVTDKLVIGPLSLFAGPVSIVNTIPPDAPVIRYFTLAPPTVTSATPLAVTFYCTPFSPEDTITKVRIYRTLDPNNALALQTMEMNTDIAISVSAQDGIVIQDVFADLTNIPFGYTLYYRLAFIRTVINEREISEDIVGLGSNMITVNLIDIVNPAAPNLTYAQANNQLSWLPTANNGTYYLYSQNSKGNWQLIFSVTPVSQTDAVTYQLPDPLVPTDKDGNRIYYRFKVRVVNSSGLLNLTDNELTI